MRTQRSSAPRRLAAGLCLSFALPAAAELSGQAELGYLASDGERDSAKAQEYRDLSDGVLGGFLLRREGETYFELSGDNLLRDDQAAAFRIGRYGSYKLDLSYTEIPHNFAFGAKTIYAGLGSGNLELDDSKKLTVAGTLVSDIKALTAAGLSTDIGLARKRGRAELELQRVGPLRVRVEAGRESRTGTRPLGGSFGFGHTEELPEPLDYATTDFRVSAEYVRESVFLSASYFASIFENNIGELTWDNPFRKTDSTSATAYTATTAAGAATGRLDLAPDNQSHAVTLTGAFSGLPLSGRLTATAAAGLMRQTDAFLPFTTNTSITNAALAPYCASTKASDVDCLPASAFDGKIQTLLFNTAYTARPLSFLDAKLRYRYYAYDNQSGIIDFPGYVRMDGAWSTVASENEAPGYKTHTAGADVGWDLPAATRLGLAYQFEKWKREHREVHDSNEHLGKVTLDNKLLSFLDLRASVSRSQRRGDYDYTVPFGGATVTAQLPLLRKYDEAERDRDRAQLMATLTPVDPLTLSGQVAYGKDDFKNSSFGLLSDEHFVYGADASLALGERLELHGFYSREEYDNKQRSRQWSPVAGPGSCVVDGDTTSGEFTDPYNCVTGVDSPANWTARAKDIYRTVGGGVEATVVQDKLDLLADYTLSESDGRVDPASAVGANIDVDPNNFTPVPLGQSDDTTRHAVDARVRVRPMKDLQVLVGWRWEKLDIRDYNNGAPLVPTNATGGFQSAVLMGTLPAGFDANVLYTKVAYRF